MDSLPITGTHPLSVFLRVLSPYPFLTNLKATPGVLWFHLGTFQIKSPFGLAWPLCSGGSHS